MKRWSSDMRTVAALTAVFLAAVVLAAPWGAHPMNDDWTHARAIADWLATGRFAYPAWLSAYMYVPILYGAALSKIFGFSFLLLRLTNVACAAGSLALFFLLLRRSGISRPSAVAATALLAANPLFFLLATTAMGDIPALFFLLLAVALFRSAGDASAPSHPPRLLLLAAGAAFALAFFTRQIVGLFGIAIVAFGILPHSSRTGLFRRRWRLIWFIAPVLIGFVALRLLGVPEPAYATHLIPEGWSLARQVVLTGWQFFLLVGLCTSPLVIGTVAGDARPYVRLPALAVFAATLLAAGLGVWKSHLIGELGNIITPFGLGPTTEVLQGTLAPFIGHVVLVVVTVICALAAAATVLTVWFGRRAVAAGWDRWGYVWSYAAATCVALLFLQSFDRYLLLLLPAPMVALAYVLDARPWSRGAVAIAVAALAAVSVVGTHDAHAWQRARWTLGERLVARGIPADRIEGGYEWDGWQFYGRNREMLPNQYTPFWAPWWVRELFPGHPMTVILSFSALGGYRVIDREPVHGWAFPVDAIVAAEIVPRSLP